MAAPHGERDRLEALLRISRHGFVAARSECVERRIASIRQPDEGLQTKAHRMRRIERMKRQEQPRTNADKTKARTELAADERG